jgi:hypothetical protein
MINATKPSDATPRQPNEPITAADTIGAIKPPAEKKHEVKACRHGAVSRGSQFHDDRNRRGNGCTKPCANKKAKNRK